MLVDPMMPKNSLLWDRKSLAGRDGSSTELLFKVASCSLWFLDCVFQYCQNYAVGLYFDLLCFLPILSY